MERPPASVALWMPWFIKEHRANASTLTHIEHSALCYLLMLFWEHDGKLPNDDKFLAKNLRLTVKQWQAMRDGLLRDCVVNAGTIAHPGLIAEIAKARVNVEQKRKAGLASAAARKAQRESNGCSTAVATAVQPRAGNGDGLSQDKTYLGEVERGPFRVLGGGGQ